MSCRTTPLARPVHHGTLAAVFVLAGVMLASTVGCTASATHRERGDDALLREHGLAATASGFVVVPTVEDVMVAGNLMTWAEQAFGFLQNGEYAMSLPYLDACLESGQASSVQRAYLYWFKSLAHRELGQESREIHSLERFVMAVEAAPADLMGTLNLATARGDWIDSGQAHTRARARLFAIRVERDAGFGRSLEHAIPASSLDEQNQVLMQLRCGPDDAGRLELEGLETTAPIRTRVYDVHSATCSSTGEALELYFDVTDARLVAGD